MPIKYARPTAAIAARMRQLKTDKQTVIASAFTSMFGHERFSQVFNVAYRVAVNQKLIGIRAAVLTHRSGFASPDEFCAACSEVAPPADRQFAWPTVRRAVPAFHRLNRETVSDVDAVNIDRLGKGGSAAFGQNRIAWNGDAVCVQVIAKRSGVLQTSDAQEASAHTAAGSLISAGSFLGRSAIEAAPARARTMSTRKPVRYAPL